MFRQAWERVALLSLAMVCLTVVTVAYSPMGAPGRFPVFLSQRSNVKVSAGCAVATPNVPDGPDPWGGCFPGTANTGVPAGTVLTAYTGSCVITADNTIIDGKNVDCSGGAPDNLSIHASNVTIRNSYVHGIVFADTDLNINWSFTLIDSQVDGLSQDLPTTGVGNVTIVRSNLHGGHNGLQCDNKGSVCSIKDSYIHGQYQPATGDSHLGGMLTDGLQSGATMQVQHNTVACDAITNVDGGGCSGDINLIPNFAFAHDVTIQKNLLVAAVGNSFGFCTYGGDKPGSGFDNGFNIVYRDNIFQKGSSGTCGFFGPVSNYNPAGVGNVWSNNLYDDGTSVPST
jgi:hypothetical protein